MKQTLRTAVLLTFASTAMAAFSNVAQAQKVDIAFGISSVDAPGASSVSLSDTSHSPVSLTGGTYPGFSGDVIFWHHLGIGSEIYWRASQSDNYLGSGFNYRPLFYDVNAVYSPRLASHTYLELVGGIGALSTRFYTGTSCGPYSCTNYQSSNHFDADFGAGIKFYPKGGFFVRPEARIYLVNNNVDYSSAHVTRYGLSIGYTFGGR
ncbi:MAG TPA: outer membrane beta-barrel protein [Terriglobales bacterium]|nr:outer membrane beta-barrel protein [Terriglobales bacterium]